MAELWGLSATRIAAAVGAGEVSASEVLEAHLARLEEVEPKTRAFLLVDAEGARAQAAEVDRRVGAGEPVGALAGVPVALKDNLSVEGEPLSCGSRILEGYRAPYTATAVERLLAAGAVMVGKTNMDEFGMGSSCENSAFQTTRNPWCLDRVPGGSSGGSAAAVAAGCVALGLGSDTGGSIRQPAAFCGLVGLKGTYGRVSRYGLVAFGSSLDQIGPIAREVEDAAVALGVIAGADPRDATSSREPVGDLLHGLEGGIEGWRVGVIREVETGALDAAGQGVWQASLERLQEAGAELVEVSVPLVRAAIQVYYLLATSEASANLARFDGVRYGRRAPEVADLQELYLESRSQGFGAEVKRRILLGTFALSAGYYDAYYGRARAVQAEMRRQLERSFEEVDLLVTPTAPGGAFALGEKVGDPLSMYLSDIYTTPASLAGLPAIAVPAGRDGVGLPLSVQLIARPFDEGRLLCGARALERAVGWEVAPPFAMGAGR